ncbi:hypothetical protein [Streptomyces salyersiae]|uniref:Minor tail protein n=1 Tax=Streptomyces salyersiae TaxID=3075530 RepID=A0ABU2RWX5_9ACTN|nr:hypothetical protein [Streptomyces sp. DSM 41770]MDT0432813.1 hypothetical protein [Streptomyces sp. DSM 41770]
MAYVPQDLLDRINALEREVRTLRGRAQIRPAMNQVLNGDVVIGEGGRLLVRDPDGDAVFETGQAESGDWFVTMRRDTGDPAISVGANAYPGDTAVKQMIRVFNRDGLVIMMDDYYADGYLGRPYVPIPMSPGVPFTADTETSVYSGHMVVQHKVLNVNALLSAPAGTTARVRLTLNNNEIGAWTINSATTQTEINERIPLSPTEFPHSTSPVAVLWAQRTAGTGTCTLRLRGLWGLNTITESEAN